ncbi:Leucine-responsive regulatory protein [Leucobacter aridicollis]|uniref:Lrp/AsnC family transcriptional regulator n=1 Tax=Leucobacter aridicollis TaxID=283878 RepID=UPI000F1498EC|nr:Lrp/AsnC family transcriptional regulator [Leucobacter aridicollis]RKQ83752.1 DNA-binding Lrp family transcriptional regulator [Mycolicibacterium mucogenicum 261Sha1.1M5]
MQRDDIDRQILAELTTNARISLVTLGERVRLSRNAVRLRVERMEREGVIQGYTVVRGRPGGDERVAAMLFVYRADRMRGAEVLAELAKIPEVKTCDILTGDFDLLARVDARSIERVQEIWEFVSRLPGVHNTVTSISLSTTIDRA